MPVINFKHHASMKKTLAGIAVIICILSTSHCAKRGTPTGGLKDSLPPVLVNANPPLNNTNFDAEKVVMVFDEYMQLIDLANQLIVSPPLEKSDYTIFPEGTISKKVEIRFNKPPRDNTTYTFNFGGSILDYNEGNAYPFFSYTFSTGDYLDSLQLSGVVKNAYENKAPSRISIHLYPIDSTYTDSTIFLQKPLYVGNTLDSVYFNLQSLAPGKYEFLAIEDVSKNYVFDQNIDKIGFFNSPIELPQDSLKFPLLFKEIPNFQWGQARLINDHHLEVSFFGENTSGRKVILDSTFQAKSNGFFTRDREKDTLHYWFTPQEELDSLVLQFEEKDSLRPFTVKPFRLVKDSLEIAIVPGNNQSLNFLDTLKIKSNLPIVSVDNDYIQIFDLDTLEVPFRTWIDENKDYIYFDFDKLPNDTYRLQLLPNAITDFLGATNDTLKHSVRTKAVEDYGNLFLTVTQKDPSTSYFFELLDERGNVVRKVFKNQTNFYSLEYLLPGNYQIRMIKDRNGNGRWDTGNYLQKRQPEEVFYLEEYLNLRANWDLNETFTIE